METDKLVYQDGEFTKVLKGKYVDEDEHFLQFECDSRKYRINKEKIISIRQEKSGGEE